MTGMIHDLKVLYSLIRSRWHISGQDQMAAIEPVAYKQLLLGERKTLHKSAAPPSRMNIKLTAYQFMTVIETSAPILEVIQG